VTDLKHTVDIVIQRGAAEQDVLGSVLHVRAQRDDLFVVAACQKNCIG